jgi:hypothetical protein
MIVLLSGMPRSASTWSYNVCRELCALRGLAVAPASGLYRTGEVSAPLAVGAAPGSALLVKCHFPPRAARALVAEGRLKNLYTVRDPRDATASLMRTFGTGFRNSARQIERSLRLFEEWEQQKGSLILEYDQIMTAPGATISRIAEYLGLALAAEEAQVIGEALSRPRLRERVRSLDPGSLKSLGVSQHDPASLLTREHLPADHPAEWRRDLSRAQGRFLSWCWRAPLARLGMSPSSAQTGGILRWPERLYFLVRLRLWRQRP